MARLLSMVAVKRLLATPEVSFIVGYLPVPGFVFMVDLFLLDGRIWLVCLLCTSGFVDLCYVVDYFSISCCLIFATFTLCVWEVDIHSFVTFVT